MSNKRILYHFEISPPARAVRVVARLLDLELELRHLDLFRGEHWADSFVKLNPEHTVPTLIDEDGFVIWDSQAICAYLVDKYAKDDKLYPKDLQLRAKCNQRLLFNATSLFQRLCDIGIPVYTKGCTEVSQDKINLVANKFEILEAFLLNDQFLVGGQLTIADICSALSVLMLKIYVPLMTDKFPKIVAWLNRINKEIPWFEEMNGKYTEKYRQLIHEFMDKNKEK